MKKRKNKQKYTCVVYAFFGVYKTLKPVNKFVWDGQYFATAMIEFYSLAP